MSDTIKWGLLGLGSIARKFATGLQSTPGAEIYAVGSRSQDKADAFGAEFGASQCHGSYEALAADPDVDVIYVATPHNYHKPNTIMCLEAGKHVLCEKPFAVNADEAQAMIDCARAKGLFLMDAFWTRFFPAMAKVRELVSSGAIGDVMLVQADFGYRTGQVMPESRLYDMNLAGGALLDVGSYCVQLASMVYGRQPKDILTQAVLGETGVDELSTTLFRYSDYEMATITTAIRLSTPQEVRIVGTKGYISIPSLWWVPRELLVVIGGQAETLTFDMVGNGYNYQAVEVGDCIRAGKLESDVMPLDETHAIMQTLDRIRAQWGLRYPFE